MPEPQLAGAKTPVKLVPELLSIDKGDPRGVEKILNAIPIQVDYFLLVAAANQIKRLISKGLPKYVGLSVYGLSFYDDGASGLNKCTQDFWE